MRKAIYPALLALTLCAAGIPDAYAAGTEDAALSPGQTFQGKKAVCSGTVVDEQGEPLIGASVFVEGSKAGTSTASSA